MTITIKKLVNDPLKWEIYKTLAFKGHCWHCKDDRQFLLTKRKKEKIRVSVGTIQINGGVLGSFTIKEVLIGLGFRKVGVIGTCEVCKTKSVQCPFCKSIQPIKEEYQNCFSCKKNFYIFDDNW